MSLSTLADFVSHPRLEYEALTHAVGLIDLPEVGVLRLRGADRVRFLNAMVTNDVAKLGVGTSCDALLTSTKGRVVAEVVVLARADELVVLVLQGSVQRVFEALDSHIIADDVQLSDMTAEMTVVALEGPKSRETIWRIFPREPLPLEVHKFTENEYQGLRATVLRRSVSGEKGFLVMSSRGDGERLRTYLVQAGVGMDMRVVGRVAWNIRRVEAGLPWYGVDVTEDNFPKEARLDDHISYEKGCYMGQEPIARMHYRGHPNWLLVGLTTEGVGYPVHLDDIKSLLATEHDQANDAVRAAASVLSLDRAVGVELFSAEAEPSAEPGTKAAGRVTSAVQSPRLRKPLFLGYVRAKMAEAGTTFRANIGSNDAVLTVIDLPLPGPIKGEKHA